MQFATTIQIVKYETNLLFIALQTTLPTTPNTPVITRIFLLPLLKQINY